MIYLKVKIVKEKEVIYESPKTDKFGYKFEYSNKKPKTINLEDLENANLYNANLRYANLENANLYNANLENANLYNANLRYANLENANLYNANLYNANLRYANLYNANLRYANLYNANLYNANLRYANLENANLYNANLENANLYNANLRYANLENANLYNANLYNANLRYANLENANLYNANLYNANLENANLYNANLDEKEQIRKGKIMAEKQIVYKKCRNNTIVELELQIGSIVFSINGKKCRTQKAKVVSIDGSNKKGLTAISGRDNDFIYDNGRIIEILDFDLAYNVECSTGIHFFWTKEEAEKW